MCYNCGCEQPNDDMGKGKVSEGGGSLTEGDFKHMADKWGMPVSEAKNNVMRLLEKQLRKG